MTMTMIQDSEDRLISRAFAIMARNPSLQLYDGSTSTCPRMISFMEALEVVKAVNMEDAMLYIGDSD